MRGVSALEGEYCVDMQEVGFRWMGKPHLTACSEITGGKIPRSELLGLLRDPRVMGLVALDATSLLGFVLYRIVDKNRARLLHVCVAPCCRRQGLGRGLLVSMAYHAKRRSTLARVGERKLGVQLFMRACGFRALRVVRDRRGKVKYLFLREEKGAQV